MNFLPGEVSGLGAAGVQVAVGGGAAWAARVHPGGASTGAPVTLGIRPEHVQLGQGPAAPWSCMSNTWAS